ncbi:hypothetical protein LSAT2_015651, partial [Lamellibrachia satsuma]
QQQQRQQQQQQQQQQLQQLEVELSQLKEASCGEYALRRPDFIVVRAWLRGPTYIGCHSGKKVVTGLSGYAPRSSTSTAGMNAAPTVVASTSNIHCRNERCTNSGGEPI